MTHVFLLGDSIRMGSQGTTGYEPFLRRKSLGAWVCHSPQENCQFAQYALRHVHQWAEGCPAGEIGLVIFNCGLWDVLRMFGDDPLTPPEVYGLMLRRLVARLRLLFPRAALLFLTSTPTVEARYTGPSRRTNDDIRQYNAIARSVMEELGVAVLDLFAVAQAFPLSWRHDHVHYTDAGSQALADAIFAAGTAILNTGE